jgi:phage tail protein X
MVNQQVLPQMRLLCFPYEEECRIYFACYTSYGNSWEVDDASLHLEQNDGEADSGQFCPNGIILSQSEQTCVGLMRMILWRRIRKSLKGQAFCVRYSRRWSSAANKHNLCRGGRMH